MAESIKVRLSIKETIEKIDDKIVNGSFTGERIDYYELKAPEETTCVVLVYEKHYYRAGNRLTLTVTVDDFNGYTRVSYISGGGGEGFFKFDWGASSSFEETVTDALEEYIMN